MAGIARGQSIFEISRVAADVIAVMRRSLRTTRDKLFSIPSRLRRYRDKQFEACSSGFFGTAQFGCFAKASME